MIPIEVAKAVQVSTANLSSNPKMERTDMKPRIKKCYSQFQGSLARMGSVCRRSTMPATDCSAARTLSCVVFKTIMSYLFLYFFNSN